MESTENQPYLELPSSTSNLLKISDDLDTLIDSYDRLPIKSISASCNSAPGYCLDSLLQSTTLNYINSKSQMQNAYSIKQGQWLSVKNPTYPVIIEIQMIIATKVDVICVAFPDLNRIPECFSIYGVP